MFYGHGCMHIPYGRAKPCIAPKGPLEGGLVTSLRRNKLCSRYKYIWAHISYVNLSGGILQSYEA